MPADPGKQSKWQSIEHRVGLLIPSSNSLVEPEYYAVMPRSVSVHFARLKMTEQSHAGFARQDVDIVEQSKLLATANVEVILFCVTAASFYLGIDYEAKIKQRIEAKSGKPALTAAQTMIDALRVMGIARIALATPFVPTGTDRGRQFFAANGFDVMAAEGLDHTDNFSIALIEPETVCDLVRRVDTDAVEAIVIIGGNMQSLSIVEKMEAELDKPVVTTNQAGIWALLRHLGGVDQLGGAGRLLRQHLVG